MDPTTDKPTTERIWTNRVLWKTMWITPPYMAQSGSTIGQMYQCGKMCEFGGKMCEEREGKKGKSATDALPGPILVCQWVTKVPKIHK